MVVPKGPAAGPEFREAPVDMSVGGEVVAVVSLLAILVLVGRGMPRSRWPIILLATLAVIVLVVAAERYGLWPAGWHTR